MLSISRKPGEGLWIGESYVRVYRIKGQGSAVILAIDAPLDIEIQRQELSDRTPPALSDGPAEAGGGEAPGR